MTKYLDRKNINPFKLAKRKRRQEKRKAFIQKIKNVRGKGFKALCWIVELHALFCISFSYYLAATEKMNPMENLSSTIVTEIVAPIVVMGFTRMIENIFEHNKLSFSTPLNALEQQKDEEERP